MKNSSILFALLAAPAVLCSTVQAAAPEAPEALKGMLPCNGTLAQGAVVRVVRTEEFAKLHQAALERFSKLPEETRKAIAEHSDAATVMDYNAEIWPDKAEYDQYVAAWKQSQIQPVTEVALGLAPAGENTFRVLSATRMAGDNTMPITMGSLTYDGKKNVWVSNNGELKAEAFSAGENFDFGAQTGTQWEMTKEDSLSKLHELVRITKTTDGKMVYVLYNLTEQSAITGSVIANHGYMLAFPITSASAAAAKPGQK
ncbi:MAG: hypothetical protein MJ051_01405 [Akkermansia sp.]|nr:hypothetical protein [Akkermansia sp.]